MKRFVQEVVADLANDVTASAVVDLITKLRACETAAAVTAVLGVGTATGLVLPAVLLVGAKLLIARKDRQEAAEFDKHCDTVLALLDSVRDRVEGSSDRLTELVEHKTWVWARISGSDQAAFARRVAKEAYEALKAQNIATYDHVEGLRIYSETILFRLGEVKAVVDDVNEKVDEVVQILSERERNLQDAVADLERQNDRLKQAVLTVQLAAAGGDEQAKLAIQAVRAVGDAKVLQEVMKRLTDKHQNNFVEGCRQIVELAYLRGDIDEAKLRLAKIEALIPGDPEVISWRGRIHSLRGDFDAATAEFKRLLDLDDAWKAVGFANLGAIDRTHNRLDRAEKNHQQALDIDSRLGRKKRAAVDLSQLGLVARKQGNLELAEERHRSAVAAIKDLGWPEGLAICLGSLGITLRERGERGDPGKLDEAEKTLRDTLKLNEELGRLEGMAIDLGNLAMIESFRGNLGPAKERAKDALEIDQALGDKRGQGIVLRILADIAKKSNEPEEGEELLRQAEALEKAMGLESPPAGDA